MKKTIFSALMILATSMVFGDNVIKADDCSGQYSQYNGCPPTQGIIINKMVANPKANNDYVDNLYKSDYVFKAGETVYFKLIVKSTSSVKIYNVKVVDTLPAYIEAVQGPGTFDPSTKKITFMAGDFNPNEEKVFVLTAKVSSKDVLPLKTQGGNCDPYVTQINTAEVFGENNLYNSDTAQLCVETGNSKQVVGVTQVPSTGPENGVALMITYVAMLGAGYALKRKLA